MKSPGTLARVPFFDAVFAACGGCTVRWENVGIEGESYDVHRYPGGRVRLVTIFGPVSHLLRGGRTALNLLSPLGKMNRVLPKKTGIAGDVKPPKDSKMMPPIATTASKVDFDATLSKQHSSDPNASASVRTVGVDKQGKICAHRELT
jgi:hypothetical protein